MIDPHLAFSVASKLAMLGWLGLLLSLFAASVRPTVQSLVGLLLPVLIAVAYILLVTQDLEEVRGGFGSIEAVRTLFANDSTLAAGWLHYLAFDLFVGAWIARDGHRRAIHPLLLLPCLPATFLAGPSGLLFYLALRLATGRAGREA